MKRSRLLTRQVDVTNISSRASRLVRCKKFSEIEKLLNLLPSTAEYQENEVITRAKIALAWHKKDVKTVYKLIEEGKFLNGDDLIAIWDQAHVYEAKARTAVQRHRLRQRFQPPRSICPSGVRKKRGIPKETCEAFQAWFTERITDPYPDKTERLMLAHQHGLTLSQLKNWFANARRRLRNSMPGECPKNLRQHRGRWKPVEDFTPSDTQSEKSLDSPMSETQGEQPERSPPDNCSTGSANLPPQAMWNSVVNYPAVGSVVASPQYGTFVPNSQPYQLPWLPNVTVFPAVQSTGYPASYPSYSVPVPVWWGGWGGQAWRGYNEMNWNSQNN